MSQINTNFQELISNNSNNNTQSNALDNVTGTAIITSETLQGFSMANQFAICANSGNGPVLLSCLTPMLLPTLAGTSKNSFDLTGGDGRGQSQPQTVQIQLASPFNFAGNLCNTNNAQTLQSLGLSYINLSSLTNAGTGFPLQITLNNTSNNNGSHQLTIPAATLNSLNQEVQIAQNYQIGSQIKFEPELNVSGGQQHHQQQQQQQHQQQQQQQQQLTIVNHIQDISDNDDKTKRKPRRRIPNKSNKSLTVTTNGGTNDNSNNNNAGTNNQSSTIEERLLDHKGRPFIYNCPNCPKKFTLNSRLTAHLRCHTGIRPYTCAQCGFSFTQKSYLIRHAAVHTEERPFTCERCLKTYKHYGSLANHRKLHRKEDKNGGLVGSGTSEISDSDQKPSSQMIQASSSCDANNLVSTTSTATTATMVDQTNYDNILQLHTDWSNVTGGAVAPSGDNSNATTTTYLIATNNNSDNNNAYYMESSNIVNLSHCLPGTGPVAFPDQQQMTHSLDANQSIMECIQAQQQQQQSQGFCASSSNKSTVYMDLQLISSSSPSSLQQSNQNAHNNDNILYTQVELSTDPQQQQIQSQSSSSSSLVVLSQTQQQQQQQQQTYTTTFSTTNTV